MKIIRYPWIFPWNNKQFNCNLMTMIHNIINEDVQDNMIDKEYLKTKIVEK